MELHPATLWEAISDEVPDRLAVVQGDRRITWREFEGRAARLAGVLEANGIGRDATVGLYLSNSPEYLEGYFAALKQRAVPFNVNYRYTAAEVAYLLADAGTDALIFHSTFADVVADAVARAGISPLLVEVGDLEAPRGVGLPYEEALAGAEPAARITRDPDDVTMTYTGGTTGMPKGVMFKVGTTLAGLLETVPSLLGHPPVLIDGAPAFAASLGAGEHLVSLPASPLMHATALAIGAAPAFATGGTVVLLEGRTFDPHELWDLVERERVNAITLVGDPFARPMLAALEAGPPRDLAHVRSIASSGAMFSSDIKTGLLRHLETAMILDLIAATEGAMGMSVSTANHRADTGRFRPGAGVIVITEDGRLVEAGSGEPGLLAVPGGAERYHGDDAKTAATFRVVDGVRYAVPGDYALLELDGSVTLLGRGSGCINTAGEKVFPEEVEEALKESPAVEDALVFGIDDERFGQAVAAVIARSDGTDTPVEDIVSGLRERLAGYKLPRSVVIVEKVPRTPVGKPDYPTARALFEAG